MNKSSTVLEVSELSCSIGASLARDELELHHYLSRARASFFFSSEVAYLLCTLAPLCLCFVLMPSVVGGGIDRFTDKPSHLE